MCPKLVISKEKPFGGGGWVRMMGHNIGGNWP